MDYIEGNIIDIDSEDYYLNYIDDLIESQYEVEEIPEIEIDE